MAAPEDAMQEIEGIGPRIAHDVVGFWSHERNRALVSRLNYDRLHLEDGHLVGRTSQTEAAPAT